MIILRDTVVGKNERNYDDRGTGHIETARAAGLADARFTISVSYRYISSEQGFLPHVTRSVVYMLYMTQDTYARPANDVPIYMGNFSSRPFQRQQLSLCVQPPPRTLHSRGWKFLRYFQKHTIFVACASLSLIIFHLSVDPGSARLQPIPVLVAHTIGKPCC